MKHSLELINLNFTDYKLCNNCQSINFHTNIKCNYCGDLLKTSTILNEDDRNDFIDIELNYQFSKNEKLSQSEFWKIEINV